MFRPRRHRLLTLVVTGLTVLGLLLLTVACSYGDDDEGDTGAVGEEETDGVAGVERELFTAPESYLGEEITIAGEIVEVVNPNAFRLSGPGDPSETILVMGIQGVPPDLDDDMTAVASGTVREVAEATFREEFGFGWDDAYDDLEGEVAVAADDVEVVAGDEPEPTEVEDLDDGAELPDDAEREVNE